MNRGQIFLIKKVLLRICAIFVTVLSCLFVFVFWGPMGSAVVEPLLRKYGGNSVPTLNVGNVGGTLASGIVLNNVRLASGDLTLLRANHIMIRPSWVQLLRGTLWLSDLEIGGVHAEVENLQTLAAHYGTKKSSESDGLRPLRVILKDITFATPLYSVNIDEGLLTQDGSVQLSADLGGMRVLAEGVLSFAPLEALSFDIAVGSGRAAFSGSLSAPFDVKGELHSLKLGELLSAFAPSSALPSIQTRGTVGARFNVKGAGVGLGAWGSVTLNGGEIEGIPVEASIPWRYKGGDFVISQAKIESLSADIELKVSADLRPDPITDRLFVRGGVRNIDMKTLERAFSPGIKLEGNGGMLDFWASADQKGDAAGKAFVRLPQIKVNGKRIAGDLRVNIFLDPRQGVTVDGGGEIFGARLRAEGARSAMTFTVEGLDSALLGAAFPALGALNPAGIVDLTVRTDEHFSVVGQASSPRLALNGVRLDALLASAHYERNKHKVVLEGLKARIGNAPLDLSGFVDLRSASLQFDGSLRGLNPKSIPMLNNQVQGLCDVSLGIHGTTRSPQVTVAISGNENTVADISIKRLRLTGVFADDRVTLPETVLLVPGGSLSFRGEIDLPRGGEARLNLSGALSNFDLKTFSKPWDTPVSGRLEGTLRVAGPISGASLSAVVKSDKISVASTDIRALHLDFSGTTQNVTVRRASAKINGGTLEGTGNMTFNRHDKIDIALKAQGIDIRSLLTQFGVDGVVGGYLDGSLLLQGTPLRPELTLKVTSPLTIRETLVDRLTVTVVSPLKGKLEMNASGKLGELTVKLKGRLQRDKDEEKEKDEKKEKTAAKGKPGAKEGAKGGWSYVIDSESMDLDKLLTAKMPSMSGRAQGSVKAKVSGRLNGRRSADKSAQPIDILLTLPTFSTGGVKVQNVSLPIRVLGDKATVRNGTGSLFGGEIRLGIDVSMPDHQWRGTANIVNLNLEKAAQPFLKEGAVAGSADININLKGDYGTLMMIFANGDFHTSNGYIHKFSALDRITKDGRVSFQRVRGSFFWNGRDLWLNPGTQATAMPGDPLYRYFAVNGALGIPGEGLALNCQGRFDVNILNQILGALKGVFQLMTGTLTGSGQLMRQTVARMVGITERDFQEVSFQLKGSWKELQLLNLRIDKSLEGVLPLNNLNKLDERKDQERKFQLNLRFPTGSGGAADSQDAQDQFKKQLLDNLLNQVN